MGTYFVLKVRGASHLEEDLLSELCFSHGAQGISEVLSFRQESLKYEPTTVETPYHDLEIYFNGRPDQNFWEDLKREFPQLRWELLEEGERDWLEEWKKGFEPFCLAGDWWVVPSWREIPREAQLIIKIDPGMAFGTGTHETTQIAAHFLAEIDLSQKSVLDVGTGTGILAMAAALGNGKRVCATEIDPTAREVARENLKINQQEDRVTISDSQVQDLSERFDVVMANIIDGVLIDLRLDLMERVAPQGYLILSGILGERAQDFGQKFSWKDEGFHQLKEVVKGEWVGYLLQKGVE